MGRTPMTAQFGDWVEFRRFCEIRCLSPNCLTRTSPRLKPIRPEVPETEALRLEPRAG